MRTPLVSLIIAAAALTGCGGSKAPAPRQAQQSSTAFPVTIGSVVIPTRPTRIVSLTATGTEMLYAVGAGSQVIAVDKYSTYPPRAPKTGLSDFDPNVESIAAEHPDLVLLSDDASAAIGNGMATLKIPALILPPAASIADTYHQIDEIGLATGHQFAATAENTKIRRELDQIVASVGNRAKGLTYYHELDDTLYSATSHTFIGQLYARLGMVNIADAAPKTAVGEYPQLSAEYLVQSNPDYVFLADTMCCHQTAATFAARPAFAQLSAVKNGRVIPLSDEIASHWGPRIVDFLRLIADAITAAKR